MLIGVPKETKVHEYRVGMTPESVAEAVRQGHNVIIESNAGNGIDASDEAYASAGAEIVGAGADVYGRAEMVVKVKEPQPDERAMLRTGQILFTYLHLAPDPAQTKDLVKSGATCIAYETVTDARGGLPLLKPMSQVAGRMSVQCGAHSLEKENGGRGTLLGGVPGVAPGRVVVLGGGVVGFHAAQMAVGLGADVTILERSSDVLERLAAHFETRAKTAYSTLTRIEALVRDADLVIGAVLIPGAAAPKLVSEDLVRSMKRGSVLVDVAIDQGGCFETSHATNHDAPTYVVHDVVHYCVANMPGAVARTSTYALNNATLPFILDIAAKGWQKALADDPHLLAGLNVWNGKVTYEAVARDLGYDHLPAEHAIAA